MSANETPRGTRANMIAIVDRIQKALDPDEFEGAVVALRRWLAASLARLFLRLIFKSDAVIAALEDYGDAKAHALSNRIAQDMGTPGTKAVIPRFTYD